jgi:hypothetical protein
MGAALGCPALLDALELHLLPLLTRRQALKVCLPVQAHAKACLLTEACESSFPLKQVLHRRTGLQSCYIVYCSQSKHTLYVHSTMGNHRCDLLCERCPAGELVLVNDAHLAELEPSSFVTPRSWAQRAERCSGGSGQRSRAAPAARACWSCALRATRCWSWIWPQVCARAGAVPRPRRATRHAACNGCARRTRLY